MKKLLFLFALFALTASPVSAEESVSIKVNGVLVSAKGTITEGRTMVPVRGVFEQLGYTAEWNAETKTATLTKGSNTIEMTSGNTYFKYNGKEITPDVPQQIINGSFMLPLRAVSEAINADVDWDAETKTASINASTGLKIGDTLVLGSL